MEDAYPGDFRHSGEPCNGFKFVNYNRVNNIGPGTGAYAFCDFMSKDSAEVAGMASGFIILQVTHQCFIYPVYSAGDRLDKSSPSNNNID